MIPTLHEWSGGTDALRVLIERFYEKVHRDPLLAPVFAHVGAEHAEHVTTWFAEVFGGPRDYTEQHGGYPAMLAHHLDLHITEEQRSRWAALLAGTADEAGLPADAEFRSALVGYVEWGTRLAKANSADGACPPPRAPVPRWGWGEAPPYQPSPAQRPAV